MITWATTVDPQTESSHSYGLFSLRRQNPGGGASITVTQDYGTTSWQNWSRTTGSSSFSASAHTGVGFEFSSDSFSSILGTNNSTTFKVSTNSGGFVISHEYGFTRRFVLSATSTETTREYTYRKTGTSESSYTYPVTTVFESDTFTEATEVSATTVTTTAVGTTQESCISTTTAADTICTPILATVVVAEKGEVIWAVNSIAATGMSGLSAATALGTTVTRTTIMPWTQTVVAPQGNSTQTTALSLPIVSQSVTYASEQYTQTEATKVVNYQSLPHESETTLVETYQTGATHLNHTILAAETITATVSKLTETIVATSYVAMAATRHQSALTTTTTATATYTREATQDYAETSTWSETYPIQAFSGSGTNTTAYTWTGIQSRTTSNNLTTFAKPPQAATMVVPLNFAASRTRAFYEGVYDDGVVAGGYSCQPIGLLYNIFPEVSRSVSSVLPTVTPYLTTVEATFEGEDEESGTYSGTFEQATEAGTMTVSGLSVTIQPSSATGTNSTATESFELQPFGSGRLRSTTAETKSAINGTSLGASESVYQTLAAGVYSEGTSTFSTSGGCRSWESGGDSQAVSIALSYIAPRATRNGASPIWWTVSRNSHESFRDLTRASNYTQA
jgi:hypothetical protein